MRLAVLLAASAALAAPAAAETCPPGTVKAGEKRTERRVGNTIEILVRDVCVPSIDVELERVEARLAHTRGLIGTLPLRGSQLEADIREWATIGEQARNEAWQGVLEMWTTLALQHLNMRNAQAKRLTDAEHRRLLGVLPRFDGTPLQRWRAEVIRRLESARSDREVLQVIQWASSTSDVAASTGVAVLDRNDLVKWGKAMIDLLQPFVRDPFLGLVLADVKLAEPVLYGYLAAWKTRGRMIDLAELGESHYREARSLSRRYMEDLAKRRELVAQGAKPIAR